MKPGWVWFSQTWWSPWAQAAQVPQAQTKGTVTRSPAVKRVTRAPVAATVPESSWPGTWGSAMSGSWPCQPCQSLRQTPVASTRTTTPSGEGAGSGSSRTSGRSPNRSKTTARIGSPFVLAARGRAARLTVPPGRWIHTP